ncbi:MAG: hypothetical protein ABJA49_13335 [Betaproteobacteria bacterium]
MRISAHSTGSNNDVTILVAIDAGCATRAKGVAGLQRIAALT